MPGDVNMNMKKTPSNINGHISVGALMRDIGVQQIKQSEYLKQYGLKPAFTFKFGRGISNYVTAEESDKIRAEHSAKVEVLIKRSTSNDKALSAIFSELAQIKQAVLNMQKAWES